MISESSLEKLKILAGAAKYNVSCASSGTKRNNTNGGIGNATGSIVLKYLKILI